MLSHREAWVGKLFLKHGHNYINELNWAEFQNTCWGLYRAKCDPYGAIPPHPLQKKAKMGFDGQKMEEITKRRYSYTNSQLNKLLKLGVAM